MSATKARLLRRPTVRGCLISPATRNGPRPVRLPSKPIDGGVSNSYPVAQHYRDRADAENGFDELKNQWGWGGFTTQDLARCQITARIVAQVYNWWSIFLRLAFPGKHLEGISSRPLLLHAIGKQTQHSGQTTLTVTSTHAKASVVQAILTRLSRFFRRLILNAEQLTQSQIWRLILSAAFKVFLRGKILQPPPLLATSAS